MIWTGVLIAHLRDPISIIHIKHASINVMNRGVVFTQCSPVNVGFEFLFALDYFSNRLRCCRKRNQYYTHIITTSLIKKEKEWKCIITGIQSDYIYMYIYFEQAMVHDARCDFGEVVG